MNRLASFLLLVFSFLLTGSALANPSSLVTTETVKVQTVDEVANVVGKIVPQSQSVQWLVAGKAGFVSAIQVTQGERIHKGQALAELVNTPETQAGFQQAQASFALAKAKLTQAKHLRAGGLITGAELAAAETEYTTAQSNLRALTAAGANAHQQVIRATGDGILSEWLATSGEWVSKGQHLATLMPSGQEWIRFGLTPDQLTRVTINNKVLLQPTFGDADTSLRNAAITSHVATVTAAVDPQTGLIDIGVPVPADSQGLLPGSWVNGRIYLRQMKVTAVERTALLHDDSGDYVFVVKDGKAHRTAVQVLIRGDQIVGVSGVQPGDEVVTAGNFELEDGAAVRAR